MCVHECECLVVSAKCVGECTCMCLCACMCACVCVCVCVLVKVPLKSPMPSGECRESVCVTECECVCVRESTPLTQAKVDYRELRTPNVKERLMDYYQKPELLTKTAKRAGKRDVFYLESGIDTKFYVYLVRRNHHSLFVYSKIPQ